MFCEIYFLFFFSGFSILVLRVGSWYFVYFSKMNLFPDDNFDSVPFFLNFGISRLCFVRFILFSLLDWSWISFRVVSLCTVTFLIRLWLRVGCLPFEVGFALILGTGRGVSVSGTVTVFWPLGLRVGVRGVDFPTFEVFVWLCTACTVTLLLILSLRVAVWVP